MQPPSGARLTVREGVPATGKAEVKSTAEDLKEGDRAWAESIASVVGCSIVEAEKRVRRIRHDKKIEAKLFEVARELGPRVVITNIEWSGPTMTDLTVSVVPAPVEAFPALASAAGASSMMRNAYQEMANVRAQAQARAAMRADVASFELRQVFGPPKTALGSIPGFGRLVGVVK